jgi:hypothetical protein
MPRPLFTPGKDPVLIVHEAVWAPGPVWTGAENFALTGIRSPDRPARSQSLYRVRYPAHYPQGDSCIYSMVCFTCILPTRLLSPMHVKGTILHIQLFP